ncbi:acetolactate synthase [Mucisphaera sp.]|uniref:acetolactate synthase n=1 Tax=Mucisphaera sp. TaxID=2913024 RepID=UPI003D0D6245
MTQAPVETPTTSGYVPPRNIQFSVFVDNRVGQLLDVAQCFVSQSLTLAGLSVVDSADHAVVRLLTSNADLARRLLKRNEMAFSESNVLAVELSEGRSLQDLCEQLVAAELNIYFAYPLLVRPRGLPVMVIQTDDIMFTAQLLRKKLFTLLAENDLGDNAPRNRPDAGLSPN